MSDKVDRRLVNWRSIDVSSPTLVGQRWVPERSAIENQYLDFPNTTELYAIFDFSEPHGPR